MEHVPHNPVPVAAVVEEETALLGAQQELVGAERESEEAAEEDDLLPFLPFDGVEVGGIFLHTGLVALAAAAFV